MQVVQRILCVSGVQINMTTLEILSGGSYILATQDPKNLRKSYGYEIVSVRRQVFLKMN